MNSKLELLFSILDFLLDNHKEASSGESIGLLPSQLRNRVDNFTEGFSKSPQVSAF